LIGLEIEQKANKERLKHLIAAGEERLHSAEQHPVYKTQNDFGNQKDGKHLCMIVDFYVDVLTV